MIEPTVGRIVWYRAKLLANSPPSAILQQAAIITNVHSNRCVNLTVFSHDGLCEAAWKVPLVQEGDEAPFDESYCEWMPYQKAVARGDITPALHATTPAAPKPKEAILLKADKVTLTVTAERGVAAGVGHLRLLCASWEDGARYVLPGQALEIQWKDGQAVLAVVRK